MRHIQINDLDVAYAARETLRTLQALRTGQLCPAAWTPGAPTLSELLAPQAVYVHWSAAANKHGRAGECRRACLCQASTAAPGQVGHNLRARAVGTIQRHSSTALQQNPIPPHGTAVLVCSVLVEDRLTGRALTSPTPVL